MYLFVRKLYLYVITTYRQWFFLEFTISKAAWVGLIWFFTQEYINPYNKAKSNIDSDIPLENKITSAQEWIGYEDPHVRECVNGDLWKLWKPYFKKMGTPSC